MIRTAYNFVPIEGERSDLPSLAVPDCSFTIREMMQRSSRGLPVPLNKVANDVYDEDLGYTEDDDVDDFTLRDLSDIDRIRDIDQSSDSSVSSPEVSEPDDSNLDESK